MKFRPHRWLFVCSGNICRSPIAEHMARAYARRTGVDAIVDSAGTLGLSNRPAEPQMIKVGREIGLDLTAHVCKPLDDTLAEWADRILVMEYAHVAHIQHVHPGARDKVELLGRYGGTDEIDDPIGAWFTFRYRRCRALLKTCVHRFVDRMPSEVEDAG